MKARNEAYKILEQVIIDEGYASLLLRSRLNGYKDVDKGFITQLVYGTLQNYDNLCYQWNEFRQGKLPKKIEILINMSVYQLLFLDKVPDYACVNEAVDISRTLYQERYAKVVNAILRNCSRRGSIEVTGTHEEILAITTSHPLWLVKMWINHYGLEITEKLCTQSLKTKAMVGRVNLMKTTRDSVLNNPLFQKGKLADSAVYYEGNLLQSDEYQNGLVTIQDEASQMVAYLVSPIRDEKILDMCAAPGTKSIQIAQMVNDEIDITCLDIHEHRVNLIRDSVENNELKSIKALCMDSTRISAEFETDSFDCVLLDVPCSGLGVLASKPDLKLRIKPEAIDSIVEVQSQLLEQASLLVKNSGRIIYSTCTLNRKENEKQIEQFLAKHTEFKLEFERTYFPMEYDTDGFYMAKLVKVKV